MINILFSRICILTFGTMYPGYVSFKTVRAKIAEDYVKWMMYWIVFALFTTAETFTDVFLTWFPFYYESKVILILWLLPTIGDGSTFIYKSSIHPLLKKHEKRIDHHIKQMREKGQDLVLQYITEAVLYVSRSVKSFINRSFPNGILYLLTESPNGNRRAIEGPNDLIIEEEEHFEIPIKAKARKNLAKTAKASDPDGPQTSRVRSRKNLRS